jgi:hypothetical protein
MPTLTGSIDFTVKFDLTGAPTLKIIPTTTIPSGNKPTLTGYFNVLQPDGITREGSYTSPDIVWNGSSYNEISIVLRTASDGTYQRGDYVITMVADEPSYTPGTNVKSFNMSYEAATQTITQNFDLYTPSLGYSDDTVYTKGDYTIISQSSAWAATSAAGTPAPSTSASFDLVIGGQYYDTAFSITYAKQVTYTHNIYTWLTVVQGWSYSVTADSYIPAAMSVLLGYLDTLKAERDASYCDKPLEERYEEAAVLYTHIRSKVCSVSTSGLKDYFDQFYRLTHNYTNPTYTHTNTVIPPYDFTTGCAGSGGGGGSTTPTVVIECVIGNAYSITGSSATVTGLTAGSSVVSSSDFANVRIEVIRGNIPIPGTDPLDGSNYFSKTLSASSFSINNPLVTGEYIKIKTIPN